MSIPESISFVSASLENSSRFTAMSCPQLKELPAPPAGRIGWPWTEESGRLPARMPGGREWPTITVVTPSFNQGRFLEETIRSILLQGYPSLEYFVLDGGSSDDSVEIIKKYAPWLTHWVSRRDSGQSDAINRGLQMGSGLFATWINSDDMLCKNAFYEHALKVGFNENYIYVGDCILITQADDVIKRHRGKIHSLEDLVRIGLIWRAKGPIIQPETLFPRRKTMSVGGINVENHYTMDYELWGRLLLAGAELVYTGVPFGMFRHHPDQKTRDGLPLTNALLQSARQLVACADCLAEETKQEILDELDDYYGAYKRKRWRGRGRLVRMGLPLPLVELIGKVRFHFSRAFSRPF